MSAYRRIVLQNSAIVASGKAAFDAVIIAFASFDDVGSMSGLPESGRGCPMPR
jgi:hypothetical protein